MTKFSGGILAFVLIACAVLNAAPPSVLAPVAVTDDASLQSKLDRAIRDDPSLNAAGITATVIDGKVTLNGAVPTEALKSRAERLAYAVKGVRSVDNRITVVPDS